MNNEIAAFENFQFKIGDVVVLSIDEHGGRAMVVERHLEQTAAGLTRWYTLAGTDGPSTRQEIELKLYQRPVRM